MEKNKTGKYFKYAVGEILLVVIGILIALSINNWNSNRILNENRVTLLEDIKEDLKIDTLSFNDRIKSYKNILSVRKKLLSLSQYNNISTDSLKKIINPQHGGYKLSATTFTKVVNLGLSEVSENDSLSKKIYRYYTIGSDYLNTIIDWEVSATDKEGDYWMYSQNKYEQKSNFPQFQDEQINRQNLIKLITEPKGRNSLIFNYQRKVRVLDTYKWIKEVATELIIEIENELNEN